MKDKDLSAGFWGLPSYVRADGLMGICANYNGRSANRFPLVEEIVSLEWQRCRAEALQAKKASGAEAAGEDEG
jgi:hypothetical protein